MIPIAIMILVMMPVMIYTGESHYDGNYSNTISKSKDNMIMIMMRMMKIIEDIATDNNNDTDDYDNDHSVALLSYLIILIKV